MKQSLKHTYSSLINSHITTTVFVLVFAVLGTIIILSVHAASISTAITASSGTLSGNISSCSNSSSINGKVIWFGSKNCGSNTATKTSTTSTSKTASGGSGSSSSSGSAPTPPSTTLATCSTSKATGAGSPTYSLSAGAPASGDSSTEINNAIKTASSHSGGGIVTLNAGTYTIDSTIDLASNVELAGAGEGSTTIMAGSTANVDPMITTNGTDNVTIQNLTVNQDGESNASKQSLSYYMVEDRSGSNVIFQNIATREPTTYSITAVNASDFCFRNNDVLQDPGENGKYNQLDGIHIL